MDVFDINDLQHEATMPKSEVTKLFHIEPNAAEGNCLFNSMGEVLFGDENKDIEIRAQVCNVYQIIDALVADAPENDILQKIQLTMLADPVDDDGRLHAESVCDDFVYGNMGDVLICSLLFECNIMLFSSNRKSMFNITPLLNPNAKFTIYLKFNGKDHYEAMLPKNHFNPAYIDMQEEDDTGRKYTVSHYETKAKSENRMFYVIYYENGEEDTKTEHELLTDMNRSRYKKQSSPKRAPSPHHSHGGFKKSFKRKTHKRKTCRRCKTRRK